MVGGLHAVRRSVTPAAVNSSPGLGGAGAAGTRRCGASRDRAGSSAGRPVRGRRPVATGGTGHRRGPEVGGRDLRRARAGHLVPGASLALTGPTRPGPAGRRLVSAHSARSRRRPHPADAAPVRRARSLVMLAGAGWGVRVRASPAASRSRSSSPAGRPGRRGELGRCVEAAGRPNGIRARREAQRSAAVHRRLRAHRVSGAGTRHRSEMFAGVGSRAAAQRPLAEHLHRGAAASWPTPASASSR